MKRLEDLKPSEGSKRNKDRRGRGYGSGNGGHESGRGTKGQNSRSGGKPKVGFEGGQTPIWRRFPKVGFHNPNKREMEWVNVSQLNRYKDGEEIGPKRLKQDGLIGNPEDGVKILGDGELKRELTVRADKFSASARNKIEDAGGKVVQLSDRE